jgi:hypothetical protein
MADIEGRCVMEWLVFSIVAFGLLLYRLKSISINISFKPEEPDRLLKSIKVSTIDPVDKSTGQKY